MRVWASKKIAGEGFQEEVTCQLVLEGGIRIFTRKQKNKGATLGRGHSKCKGGDGGGSDMVREK